MKCLMLLLGLLPDSVSAGKWPEPIILLPTGSRCIIVEKQSQTLFVYRYTAEELKLETALSCTTGAQHGEKVVQGDEKTPEGVYVLRTIVPPDQLPEKYGKMAITLDYPNAVDRLEGKGGSGIWLHATNEPLRASLPNRTRGCIVISNEDIELLSGLIELNRTPLIVVQRIRYRTDSEAAAEREDLKSFLAGWRSSWENKHLNRYISMYSVLFRNSNHNLAYWRSYKQAVFSRAGKITLKIDLHSITQNGRYAVLTFRQEYHSDRLNSTGVKRLFVVREAGGWKILAEEML